jgi:hypothetical protein
MREMEARAIDAFQTRDRRYGYNRSPGGADHLGMTPPHTKTQRVRDVVAWARELGLERLAVDVETGKISHFKARRLVLQHPEHKRRERILAAAMRSGADHEIFWMCM